MPSHNTVDQLIAQGATTHALSGGLRKTTIYSKKFYKDTYQMYREVPISKDFKRLLELDAGGSMVKDSEVVTRLGRAFPLVVMLDKELEKAKLRLTKSRQDINLANELNFKINFQGEDYVYRNIKVASGWLPLETGEKTVDLSDFPEKWWFNKTRKFVVRGL